MNLRVVKIKKLLLVFRSEVLAKEQPQDVRTTLHVRIPGLKVRWCGPETTALAAFFHYRRPPLGKVNVVWAMPILLSHNNNP